jgi:hypothetical protein
MPPLSTPLSLDVSLLIEARFLSSASTAQPHLIWGYSVSHQETLVFPLSFQ